MLCKKKSLISKFWKNHDAFHTVYDFFILNNYIYCRFYVKSKKVVNVVLWLEFKAVIVLPTITHNYGNYRYGNYVGNAPVGKVITLNT